MKEGKVENDTSKVESSSEIKFVLKQDSCS